MSQQEERLVTAILSGDTDVLDPLDEADAQPLAVAVSASFIALVRYQITSRNDQEITGLASTATLVDSEGNLIPRWILEAAIRSALGDIQLLEGVPPAKLIDAHAAYVRDAITTMHPAERERLIEATAQIVRDSGEHRPYPSKFPNSEP
jgi:hypothetical protein